MKKLLTAILFALIFCLGNASATTLTDFDWELKQIEGEVPVANAYNKGNGDEYLVLGAGFRPSQPEGLYGGGFYLEKVGDLEFILLLKTMDTAIFDQLFFTNSKEGFYWDSPESQEIISYLGGSKRSMIAEKVIFQDSIFAGPGFYSLVLENNGDCFRSQATGQFSFSPEIAPVPEPATMLLFGTGLAGLAAVARRRKN